MPTLPATKVRGRRIPRRYIGRSMGAFVGLLFVATALLRHRETSGCAGMVDLFMAWSLGSVGFGIWSVTLFLSWRALNLGGKLLAVLIGLAASILPVTALLAS